MTQNMKSKRGRDELGLHSYGTLLAARKKAEPESVRDLGWISFLTARGQGGGGGSRAGPESTGLGHYLCS